MNQGRYRLLVEYGVDEVIVELLQVPDDEKHPFTPQNILMRLNFPATDDAHTTESAAALQSTGVLRHR